MIRFNPLDHIKVAGESLVATVDAGTLATVGIEMEKYNWLMFFISTTDADADTTIDAKIQEDSAVGMGSPTDVANLAITQFTAAATAKHAILVVHENDLSEAFCRCLVTAGNGTSGAEINVLVLGQLKHYAPGDHAATVQEVVALDIS